MNCDLCTFVIDFSKLFDLTNWWERKSLSAKSMQTHLKSLHKSTAVFFTNFSLHICCCCFKLLMFFYIYFTIYRLSLAAYCCLSLFGVNSTSLNIDTILYVLLSKIKIIAFLLNLQNLDNWKSSRRKRVEHIIDRVVEVKKLELEEHDRTRRKSKTFSEMIEER